MYCLSSSVTQAVRYGSLTHNSYERFCFHLQPMPILAGRFLRQDNAGTDMSLRTSPHGWRLDRRWRYPLRSLITLPMLFEKRVHDKDVHAQSRKPQPPEVSALVLRRTLRSTRKLLHSVASASPVRSSRWSHYTETASHYESADHNAKKDFVSRSLEQIRPARVLDVGANTGVYSRVAAATGAEVVAWDTDVQATDLNWQTAIKESSPILPLIADFARPTPALGWQNQETGGLLSRARGQFDCVLMLGILHHLLLADQIPLPAVLNQLAEISKRWAVVEWIPQGDSQFVWSMPRPAATLFSLDRGILRSADRKNFQSAGA